MSVAWAGFNQEEHNEAWELAKLKTGVTDVRVLTPQQFSDLVALAEAIRKGEVNVKNL